MTRMLALKLLSHKSQTNVCLSTMDLCNSGFVPVMDLVFNPRYKSVLSHSLFLFQPVFGEHFTANCYKQICYLQQSQLIIHVTVFNIHVHAHQLQ